VIFEFFFTKMASKNSGSSFKSNTGLRQTIHIHMADMVSLGVNQMGGGLVQESENIQRELVEISSRDQEINKRWAEIVSKRKNKTDSRFL